MKKKVLFLDRDGTLIVEPSDNFQIDSLEKLEPLKGVFRNLYEIYATGEYVLVIVTNQDGLGTATFPEESFIKPHQKMIQLFANEGIIFVNEHIDKTFKHENSLTRKPRLGLLQEYLSDDYDLTNSYVIGDRLSDIKLAQNLGSKGILIGECQDTLDNDYDLSQFVDTLVLKADSWDDIGKYFKSKSKRKSTVTRTTSETSINLSLDLDNYKVPNVKSGVGFLDHMLILLASHARITLNLSATGDLYIDAHHTIEDIGISLGLAFKEALGNKKGIERYGFCILPMDEAKATVALDFSGRSELVWKGKFPDRYIGEFPVEMVIHFFKSFADNSGCNINIAVKGDNTHHMIEAIFKSVARSIKVAIGKSGYNDIASTKGSL
jgi:imidazoleglycerol-phosphate dehydratase / histidinol-phosphatase